MKAPWDSSKAECRIFDTPCKNLDDFKAYLEKYSEKNAKLDPKERRFFEPEIVESLCVTNSHRTQADLYRAVLNYLHAVPYYREEDQNCQHFAADFMTFLTGRKVPGQPPPATNTFTLSLINYYHIWT
jgi:hypothetical protein